MVVAVALCVLSPLSAPTAKTTGSPRGNDTIATFQCNSMIAPPARFALPRSSKLTYLTPWKARPKIVLGESDERLSEESDSGPVLFPSGLSSALPTPTTTSRQPSLSPLRC
jgi:hypothetical protein